jgi:uncharacterized membrane protein
MPANFRRNLLTGVVTFIPLMVTGLVFGFFLDLLTGIGRPKVAILASAVSTVSPQLGRWLLEIPWLSSSLAIVLTLGMLYLLGWAMSRMVGRQILTAVEDWLKRVPGVTTIYGSTKRLIETFQTDGGGPQRVVLIPFPHARMKAVGLVTRTFRDEETGEELAAVYVPTAPNPTGGYLEIVPMIELVPLNWSVDEAMTFVLSGGTTAPDHIRFGRSDARVTASGLPCEPAANGPSATLELTSIGETPHRPTRRA